MKSRIKRWIQRKLIEMALAIGRHELAATKKEIQAQMAEAARIARQRDAVSGKITIAAGVKQEYTREIALMQVRHAALVEEHSKAVDFLGDLLKRRDLLEASQRDFIKQLEETA